MSTRTYRDQYMPRWYELTSLGGTSWHGYKLTLIRVDMGTSWHSTSWHRYELTWVRVDWYSNQQRTISHTRDHVWSGCGGCLVMVYLVCKEQCKLRIILIRSPVAATRVRDHQLITSWQPQIIIITGLSIPNYFFALTRSGRRVCYVYTETAYTSDLNLIDSGNVLNILKHEFSLTCYRIIHYVSITIAYGWCIGLIENLCLGDNASIGGIQGMQRHHIAS